MTVITPVWPIQASSHPASTVRQAQQGQMGSPAGSFAGGVQPTTGGGGHGACGASDLAVTANGTPNMSVNVAQGLGAIRGTESQHQGVYGPGYNDATLNLAIAAADATNGRKDLVCMKVRDAQYSGVSNDISLVVVTGTPAGSPVDPSPPANCIVLARVQVDAAVTSIVSGKITDVRPRASALGGVQVCTAATRPTGAALYSGLTIWERDTLSFAAWDGTAWRHYKTDFIDKGTLAVPFAAVAAVNATITFNVTFASAPIVMVVMQIGANLDVFAYLQGNPTTTQVAIRCAQNAGAPVTDAGAKVHWIAIGQV